MYRRSGSTIASVCQAGAPGGLWEAMGDSTDVAARPETGGHIAERALLQAAGERSYTTLIFF